MFELSMFVVSTLLFLVLSAFIILRYMHMFQLNSYKSDTQLKWLKKDVSVIFRRIYLLLTLPIVYILGVNGLLAACLLLLVAIIVDRPKKAKKPLVYTGRVARMLGSIAAVYVLFVLLCAVFYFVFKIYIPVSLYGPVVFFISPFTVIFANWLNKAHEKSINDGFIRDAERIIKEMPELKVIGVTGSYGKTSVKFYLGKILSAKYNVLVTPESYNTTLGVVRTVRERLRPTHEIFVCEMGAKSLGEIKEICDIVHPQMGVITSIGPQHLETFLSIENVIETKFELEKALPQDGIIFLNTDNEYIAAQQVNAQSVTYGIDSAADYRARDIKVSEHGSEFTLTGRDGTDRKFTTKLIGRHNVLNIAAAIAVADTLGVSMDDIAMQVRRLESVPHRLQLIVNGNNIVIDDAYNSNPSGAKAALDVLKEFEGLKVLVTPGMIELGEKQYELNNEFGTQAAEVCDYAVLVGEKQTKPIYEGLISAGFAEGQIIVVPSIKEALTAVSNIKTYQRKIVLLENDLPDNY